MADFSEDESLFKALADRHRLRILATIARSGETSNEITFPLGRSARANQIVE